VTELHSTGMVKQTGKVSTHASSFDIACEVRTLHNINFTHLRKHQTSPSAGHVAW